MPPFLQKALNSSIFETLSEDEAAAAALRIQSAARGRQARKRVDQIREERGVPKGSSRGMAEAAAAYPPPEPEPAPAPAPAAAEAEALFEGMSQEELEAAALKIQSLQRGRAARARVEELKRAQAAGEAPQGGVVEVADVAEAFANLSPEEAEAAAIRIQAVHRGRVARKNMAARRQQQHGADAGGPVDAAADAAAAGEPAAGEEEAQLEVADVQEAFANLSPEEAEAAALKIQAIQRGRMARKQVASLKNITPPQGYAEPAAGEAVAAEEPAAPPAE